MRGSAPTWVLWLFNATPVSKPPGLNVLLMLEMADESSLPRLVESFCRRAVPLLGRHGAKLEDQQVLTGRSPIRFQDARQHLVFADDHAAVAADGIRARLEAIQNQSPYAPHSVKHNGGQILHSIHWQVPSSTSAVIMLLRGFTRT
ncbi:hypothetical protein PYCCODRAFT_727256 [Trametes coccinea BRFM310]|uniref:Uncharacterized protein n=1 Tax=Trametes coccinea (strain BRFM310) TaxID=1353009 RepID=A0A1Y2IIE4_TRAC3|nr:hypothetical protein PYCCODRAFT_727256 [Trametes coccinea BRFM310]